jgi:hypothetical protein
VVTAVDANATRDADFTGMVVLSVATGGGAISGDVDVASVGGVATFTDVAYTATADQEAFTLRAFFSGAPTASGTSAAVTSDVVATQIVFSAAPTAVLSGQAMSPVPTVKATDASGLIDTDFTESVSLALGTGAGSLAVTSPVAASAGVAVFSDAVYTATANGEVFTLTADDDAGTGSDLGAVTTGNITATTQRNVTLNLSAGFNLVSWNVAPTDTTMLGLVTPLGSRLLGAFTTETASLNPNRGTGGASAPGSKSYNPAFPQFSSLKATNHRLGYWLRVDKDTSLVVSGLPVSVSGTPLPLDAGFSLVGYMPDFADSVRHVTQALLGNIVGAFAFESAANNPNGTPGSKSFNPSFPQFSTLKVMAPGLGYWIRMGTPTSFTYPTSGVHNPSAKAVVEQLYSAQTNPTRPSMWWLDVFGSLSVDGEPAPRGTVVDVVDGTGTIAGWAQVDTEGQYGFLPIYLDYQDTPEDEGAEVGEWLAIRVNGTPTGDRVQWTSFGEFTRVDLSVASATVGEATPLSFGLGQNYPNPFNPETTITYELAAHEKVQLTVYNLAGQQVRQLVDMEQPAGAYRVTWDGRDASGQKLASGVYLYMLRAGDYSAARKVVLSK